MAIIDGAVAAPVGQVGKGVQYRTEIDGLRGISVIAVILFHAGVPGFGGGYVGVDVFFTLSGYLIPTIVMSDIERGRFSVMQFYERRIRRILPALIVILLACTPVAYFVLTPGHLERYGESALAAAFVVSNIYFLLKAGYFAADAELLPWLHTWSLGVEEQFYLLFPLLFALGWKMGLRWIWLAVVAAALFGLILAEWAISQSANAAFYLLPFRVWEFAFGMTAALIRYRWPMPLGGWVEQVLSLLGLAFILCATFIYTADTPFPGVYALLPVVGTVFVILFATENAWTTKLLKWRPLVMMGLMSYSAYLWHQPVFAFVRNYAVVHPPLYVFILLSVLSVGLAYLTWRFVEVPFRNREKYTAKKIYLGIATSLAGLTVVFVGLQAWNGHDYRFDEARNEISQNRKNSPKAGKCYTYEDHLKSPEQACRYWHDDVRIAVFGDSHVIAPAYGLAEALKDAGQGVLHYSFFAGFPAFTTPQYPSRHKWSNDVLNYLISQPMVETVVLVYRHQTYLDGENLGHYPGLPNEMYFPKIADTNERQKDVYVESFNYAVQKLLDAGKRVVVVLPVPDMGRDAELMIYRSELKDGNIVGVSRAYYEKRLASFKDRFDPAGFMGDLTIVDPTDWLCDEAQCYFARDGVAYYRDDDHLNVAGGIVLGRQILAALDNKAADEWKKYSLPEQPGSSASTLPKP